jgi:hypothetical protein
MHARGLKPHLFVEVDFPELIVRKIALIRNDDLICTTIGPELSTNTQGTDQYSSSTSADVPPSSSSVSIDPSAPITMSATASAKYHEKKKKEKKKQDKQKSDGKEADSAPEPAVDVSFITSHYRMIGADLCDLDSLGKKLARVGIDMTLPTLFLSECVLTYVDVAPTTALIAWAARYFQSSVFVTYEQIIPEDAFGNVMTRHFAKIGILMSMPFKLSQFVEARHSRESVVFQASWHKKCDIVNVATKQPRCTIWTNSFVLAFPLKNGNIRLIIDHFLNNI